MKDQWGHEVVEEDSAARYYRKRLAEVEAQRDGLRRAVKLAIELDVAGAFDHMEILRNALTNLEEKNEKKKTKHGI